VSVKEQDLAKPDCKVRDNACAGDSMAGAVLFSQVADFTR
jgi:hypothetical protein